MVRGAGLGTVAEPMLLLAVLGVAVFGLALVRSRRDLAPAPRRARAEPAVAGQVAR